MVVGLVRSIGEPVVLQRWLEALLSSGSPGSVALIGDDWRNDVAGARDAGWRAVYLVREGVEAHPVMPRAETPVASLDQIVF